MTNGIEIWVSLASFIFPPEVKQPVYIHARNGLKDNPDFSENLKMSDPATRGFIADLDYWTDGRKSTQIQADDFFYLISNKTDAYIPYVRILHRPGVDPRNLINWIFEHVVQLHEHLKYWPGIQMQEAKVYSLDEDANRIGDDLRHTLPHWNTIKANCPLWVVPTTTLDLARLTTKVFWPPTLKQVSTGSGYNLITTDITASPTSDPGDNTDTGTDTPDVPGDETPASSLEQRVASLEADVALLKTWASRDNFPTG